jgi:hypothetical protein
LLDRRLFRWFGRGFRFDHDGLRLLGAWQLGLPWRLRHAVSAATAAAGSRLGEKDKLT